jgi:histone acetyltransferase MCC1
MDINSSRSTLDSLNSLNTLNSVNSLNCVKSEFPFSKKKKITRVYSDAFPPNILGHKDKIPIFSEVHKKLSEIEIDPTKITYRELTYSDMEEIKLLHKEWFPVEYTDDYFEAIFNPEKRRKNYITIAATYLIEDQEYILGAVISEINSKSEFLNQTPQKFLEKIHTSFYDEISLFPPEYEFAYIMVIGVIDECRRMKLGSLLLNKILEIFLSRKNCLCVYLHVIKYNQTAIKFYEKNGFINTTSLKNYYKIKNDFFDSEVFVKFFSEKEKYEAIEQNKNLVIKIIENILLKPLKILMFLITLGLLFKNCRRKHKLD